jgi:hypothetical protein
VSAASVCPENDDLNLVLVDLVSAR